MKEQIGTLLYAITRMRNIPKTVSVIDKIHPGKLTTVTNYNLHYSQIALISKFVNDKLIHLIKIFDKVIEVQKGREIALACAKKLGVPESDMESAIPPIIFEIKRYVTRCQNNQLQDICLAFYGK